MATEKAALKRKTLKIFHSNNGILLQAWMCLLFQEVFSSDSGDVLIHHIFWNLVIVGVVIVSNLSSGVSPEVQ